MFYVLLSVMYLVLAFGLAALVVRIAPRTMLARQLRRRLFIFPVVPIILCVVILVSPFMLIGRAGKPINAVFEKMSGRPQHERISMYGYGPPSRTTIHRSHKRTSGYKGRRRKSSSR